MSFISEIGPFLPSLWDGFVTTAAVSIASILGSFIVGTALAITVIYGRRTAAAAATIYIEAFRNISFLVLIFFFYFGLPELGIFIGLSTAQRIRLIELPLALRVALRPLGSLFVNLILTTSILSTITLSELTNAAKIVAATTFRPFEVYFLLLVLYSVLTYLCSAIVHRMHVRANRFLQT